MTVMLTTTRGMEPSLERYEIMVLVEAASGLLGWS